MLALKKKCITVIHYKWKLNLCVKDYTKKTESLISTMVLSTKQVSKVKNTKKDVIRTYYFRNKITTITIIMIIIIITRKLKNLHLISLFLQFLQSAYTNNELTAC